MHLSIPKTSVATYRVASPTGTLPARVIYPAGTSGLPPLIALHGISRNARELADLFRFEAEQSGRIVVVPHFSESRWPNFQRPSRSARPDQALLALLSHLHTISHAFGGTVDLFGHSGGAQLAHRFAMLYPQKVGRLHLAAAGWYCLPDNSMAYPYGLGAEAGEASFRWARRHAQALSAYLRLSVEVFVGTQDIDRDDSLRKSSELDLAQGRNRVERAETYVGRFIAAAKSRGIQPDITLTRLPGVTHDVVQAIKQAELARLVTMKPNVKLALTS